MISDSTDTGPLPLPYWQVLLKDPNNSANTILIHGSGATGTGVNGLTSSGTVLGTLTSGGVFDTSTMTWAQLAGLVSDGTALGNWNIVSLGIGEEGQTTQGANQVVAQITSMTVGTTPAVAAVPEASTWAMLVLGFAGLGLLSYRRTHRNGGLNLRCEPFGQDGARSRLRAASTPLVKSPHGI